MPALRGSYRRDGVMARFGPDAALPDVLMALAHANADGTSRNHAAHCPRIGSHCGGSGVESYRREGADASNPFVRLFSQAPAVAPARKVTTKLSIVNVSIIVQKRSGEKKVPARLSAGGAFF